MNKKLTQYVEYVENIIFSLSLKHHVKEDKVRQIASYHGEIKLWELIESVTVATHYSNNIAHILLLNKSIEEIKEDVTDIKPIPGDTTTKAVIAKRAIIPVIVFTINFGPKAYVSMKPGVMDSIYLTKVTPSSDPEVQKEPISKVPSLGGMEKDFFDIFVKLQTLVYKP
jgi:hypothetical protein